MTPIGMKMYFGNQTEKPVLKKIVMELKGKSLIRGRMIHVADKGLNCAENTSLMQERMAMDTSSRSRSKQLPENENVWRPWTDSKDWVDVLSSDGSLQYHYKECIGKFPYSYSTNEGKTVTMNLTEKRVLTWSPRLAEKRVYEIRKMAEKAKALYYSKARGRSSGTPGIR